MTVWWKYSSRFGTLSRVQSPVRLVQLLREYAMAATVSRGRDGRHRPRRGQKTHPQMPGTGNVSDLVQLNRLIHPDATPICHANDAHSLARDHEKAVLM